MPRYTAHLVGPGSQAPAFEGWLDSLVGATLIGSESSSVATLVFDVFASDRDKARDTAARMVAPLAEAAVKAEVNLVLIVDRAITPREVFGRVLRYLRARLRRP